MIFTNLNFLYPFFLPADLYHSSHFTYYHVYLSFSETRSIFEANVFDFRKSFSLSNYLYSIPNNWSDKSCIFEYKFFIFSSFVDFFFIDLICFKEINQTYISNSKINCYIHSEFHGFVSFCDFRVNLPIFQVFFLLIRSTFTRAFLPLASSVS